SATSRFWIWEFLCRNSALDNTWALLAVSFCQGGKERVGNLSHVSGNTPEEFTVVLWEREAHTNTKVKNITEWTALSNTSTHRDGICPTRLNVDGAGRTGVRGRDQRSSAIRHSSSSRAPRMNEWANQRRFLIRAKPSQDFCGHDERAR
ncbi:hypothetical protein NPIL_207731, partial [Nephila pilipes]